MVGVWEISARQWWMEGESRQRRGQFAKWTTAGFEEMIFCGCRFEFASEWEVAILDLNSQCEFAGVDTRDGRREAVNSGVGNWAAKIGGVETVRRCDRGGEGEGKFRSW